MLSTIVFASSGRRILIAASPKYPFSAASFVAAFFAPSVSASLSPPITSLSVSGSVPADWRTVIISAHPARTNITIINIIALGFIYFVLEILRKIQIKGVL